MLSLLLIAANWPDEVTNREYRLARTRGP